METRFYYTAAMHGVLQAFHRALTDRVPTSQKTLAQKPNIKWERLEHSRMVLTFLPGTTITFWHVNGAWLLKDFNPRVEDGPIQWLGTGKPPGAFYVDTPIKADVFYPMLEETYHACIEYLNEHGLSARALEHLTP